jgi:hypothetical protein
MAFFSGRTCIASERGEITARRFSARKPYAPRNCPSSGRPVERAGLMIRRCGVRSRDAHTRSTVSPPGATPTRFDRVALAA